MGLLLTALVTLTAASAEAVPRAPEAVQGCSASCTPGAEEATALPLPPDLTVPQGALARATPTEPLRHRPLPADAPVLPGLRAERRTRWGVPVTHTASLFIGMRVGLSVLWPRAYDPSRLDAAAQHLASAYTRPPHFRRGAPLLESDGDPWLLNTVGHGLFGAEVYGRFRQCGHSPAAALLAATTASAAWEYGPEALHQRPSAIDLLWTPLAGALLGELRHTALRALAGPRPGPVRAVLRAVVDPLGTLERDLLGAGC